MSETKNDYIYTEEVQLPSMGLLNEELPEGKVTLRCVEIRDQKYLAGTKLLHSNKAVELLSRCTIAPETFDINKLTQTDLFYLLIKLRVLSYGNDYRFITRCPICGGITEVNVDLSNLTVKTLENFNNDSLFIKLPRRGDIVYTHILTQGDSEDIENEVHRLRSKFKENLEGDPEITLSIAKIINKVELKEINKSGQKILDNPVDILNYVESLTDLDALAIQSTIEDIDFGVDTRVTSICDKCNNEITVPMKTTVEFFRPRFNK